MRFRRWFSVRQHAEDASRFHRLGSPSGSDSDRVELARSVCTWPNSYYDTSLQIAKAIGASDILEVGVAYGFHAEAFLESLPDARYTGIDPYVTSYDPGDPFAGDVAFLMESDGQESMDRLYDAVKDRLQRFGSRAQLLRHASADAADLVRDESQDLIFVDGDHRLEAITTDLRVWWPKLRSGGVLLGDDFDWPEVEEAVTRFSEDMEILPLIIRHLKTRHSLFALLKR